MLRVRLRVVGVAGRCFDDDLPLVSYYQSDYYTVIDKRGADLPFVRSFLQILGPILVIFGD